MVYGAMVYTPEQVAQHMGAGGDIPRMPLMPIQQGYVARSELTYDPIVQHLGCNPILAHE